MGGPVNGTVLGQSHDWDNNPGKIVVDQLYEVRFSKDQNDLINNFFAEIDQEVPDEDKCERRVNIVLEACWQFDRAYECLEFLYYWDEKWQVKIYERRHFVGQADQFQEITKADLEQIIEGTRKPVTKFVSGMNRFFNASLGDD